jgi:hypothetical protein
VSSEVYVWFVAVVEFDFVNEVIFAISGYCAGVIELYFSDFAGFAV